MAVFALFMLLASFLACMVVYAFSTFKLSIVFDEKLRQEAENALEIALVKFCYKHSIPIVKKEKWDEEEEACGVFHYTRQGDTVLKAESISLNMVALRKMSGHVYTLCHEVGHYISIFQREGDFQTRRSEDAADFESVRFACCNLSYLHCAALMIRLNVTSREACKKFYKENDLRSFLEYYVYCSNRK